MAKKQEKVGFSSPWSSELVAFVDLNNDWYKNNGKLHEEFAIFGFSFFTGYTTGIN